MIYGYPLHNLDHSIQVTVNPAHGGMISQIQYHNHPVFQLDEKVLETTPMAAGGMPLLFPFPSKTSEDAYEMNGKIYHMPMHGLIKNSEFVVKESTASSVTLWIDANQSWLRQYYPFDFYFEVTYEVTNRGLDVTILIENRTDAFMPHYLGVHPYFFVSDKKNVSLEHAMTKHYDYINHTDEPANPNLDLGKWLDDVFCAPQENYFKFENPIDHYGITCRYDEAFDTLIVCSWVPNSMCIEPWCGVPDAINQNRPYQSIPPRGKKYYHISMEFSDLL